MQLQIVDHPLISHKLTLLCDKNAPLPVFRQLVDELTTLLAYEPTRGVHIGEVEVKTPLMKTAGRRLASPDLIMIPVLRMGSGVLEGMTRLLPTAEVSFLGMKRDEQTLAIEIYANRLPQDLSGHQCPLVDPMLAAGGILMMAINYILERGARDVICTCLLTVPEGIAAVKDAVGNRTEVEAAVGGADDHLNENAHTTPGLDDAGDCLYGLA